MSETFQPILNSESSPKTPSNLDVLHRQTEQGANNIPIKKPEGEYKDLSAFPKPTENLGDFMKVEAIMPEQFMGDITGSLSGKRGQIEGMDERGMLRVIHAKVPLSEMFGYTTDIRSMTQGRGSVQMEFDHYEVVPPNVEKTIIESRK